MKTATRNRSLAASLMALTLACAAPPQPLLAPLAPQLALNGGLRIALLDADLPALAETIRLAAGKSVELAVLDWPLPQAADGHFVGFTTSVSLDQVTLAWLDAQHLHLTAQLGKIAGNVSLVQTGQAGCGIGWQAAGGTMEMDAEVRRTPDGGPGVKLTAPAKAKWSGASLSDPTTCLGKLPADAAKALADHVEAEIVAQIEDRLAQSLLPALTALFAPTLEQSGRVAMSAEPPVEARFAMGYLDVDQHLANHAGALAHADLAVSLDVDRHPCAVDAPLPTVLASPLAQRSPPPGQAFSRRALVLDQALVQRLAWMAARSGGLCAEARGSLQTTLGPGWAADLLPQVEEWIEGPPTNARFWPGSSPSTRLIDTPAGAAVEWTIDDAQLEIIARVADTEMTVLTVTGGFRATLLPRLQGSHLLVFDVVAVERLSTHQTSPLLGDLSTAPSEDALSALCAAALQGIFAHQAVLPLLALSPGPLPAGTVLTQVDRAGDALWLWLEGGQVH
jgi:hypothetical protein